MPDQTAQESAPVVEVPPAPVAPQPVPTVEAHAPSPATRVEAPAPAAQQAPAPVVEVPDYQAQIADLSKRIAAQEAQRAEDTRRATVDKLIADHRIPDEYRDIVADLPADKAADKIPALAKLVAAAGLVAQGAGNAVGAQQDSDVPNPGQAVLDHLLKGI